MLTIFKPEPAERFTYADAVDASECGDPILVQPRQAMRIIDDHGLDPVVSYREFLIETGLPDLHGVDAAKLLGWLGY